MTGITMPRDNNSASQAAQNAKLVIYVEDSYTDGALFPPLDARVARDGWTVIGYLTGNDYSLDTNPKTGLRRVTLRSAHRLKRMLFWAKFWVKLFCLALKARILPCLR